LSFASTPSDSIGVVVGSTFGGKRMKILLRWMKLFLFQMPFCLFVCLFLGCDFSKYSFFFFFFSLIFPFSACFLFEGELLKLKKRIIFFN